MGTFQFVLIATWCDRKRSTADFLIVISNSKQPGGNRTEWPELGLLGF